MAKDTRNNTRQKKATAAKTAVREPMQRKEPRLRRLFTVFVLAMIIVIAAALVYTYVPGSIGSMPFSTFKSNFDSAQRIAVLATYNNATEFNSESICFTDIIEIMSRRRDPSTIDFFATNSTECTYSPNGLGHAINPMITTPQACIKDANSEPGLFFNYSLTNKTVIASNHMYIYGNDQYFSKCPLAADFS